VHLTQTRGGERKGISKWESKLVPCKALKLNETPRPGPTSEILGGVTYGPARKRPGKDPSPERGRNQEG